MTSAKICFELSGATETLDAGLDAFVYQNGYVDIIINDEDEEIDNPISKLTFARDILRTFMRQSISAYNINKAKQEAAELSKAATLLALNTLTFEITE